MYRSMHARRTSAHASWQSSVSRAKKNIDVGSFTAEAGKVYYFAANISMTGGGGDGMVSPTMGPNGTMTEAAWCEERPSTYFSILRN
jgi:hypothetical protein